MVNIQCLNAHLAELQFHLEQRQPHIVLLQETWLDASHGQIFIPNYKVVSRRDRKNETNRKGILTLSRNDFNDLVHIEDANEEERSWHYLHIDPEVILLANWYRPGSATHDGFESYTADLHRLCPEATGIIVTGDLNIHHERWLRYSNANTSIGADLRIISAVETQLEIFCRKKNIRKFWNASNRTRTNS